MTDEKKHPAPSIADRMHEIQMRNRQRLQDLPGEVATLLAYLDFDPDEDDFDEGIEVGPIVGLRAAARAIRVGRGQVKRVLDGLPATDPRTPVYVEVRGGRMAPWWEDADACRRWWGELHRANRPVPRGRPERRASVSPSTDRHILTGSIDDALDEI